MLVRYDINILSILMLCIILINNLKNRREGILRQKYFRALMICNILILFSDMITAALAGRPEWIFSLLLHVFLSLYLLLCLFFCLMWALYSTIRAGCKLSKTRLALLFLPVLLLIVMLAFNPTYGILFSVTTENQYARGDFSYVFSLFVFLYILYAYIQLGKCKKRLPSGEFYTYFLAPLVPIVLSVVQLVMNIHVSMIWPSAALVMLIVQFYTLNAKINLDHMTGLYNRKSLDNYLDEILQASRSGGFAQSGKKFAAIMLDLDGFKKINDTYGHLEGDRAIVMAAGLLKKSVRNGDFVSRYGGDEFLIVLDECGDATPERVIHRIRENVYKFNREKCLPYAIDFSFGYKVYSSLQGLSSKQILSGIDRLMYRNKASKTTAKPE